MFRYLLTSICLALLFAPSFSVAQEKPDTPKNKTVRGKFIQSKAPQHQIDFSEFKLKLVEHVVLPDVAPPKEWPTMTVEQRQQFLEKFKASAEGKALLAKRQKVLDERHIFDIKIDESGKWTVYDVPAGRYGIVNGRIDKVVGKHKFAYELFGQLQVSKDVEEVILDAVPVLVTPLLAAGDEAPSFTIPTQNKDSQLTSSQFRGQVVYLYFWSTVSQPSVEYRKTVQKALDEVNNRLQIQSISVNVDEDRDSALKAIQANGFGGHHGFTEKLDHDVVEAYGVRALPSQWLIGSDGKILATHVDFQRALMSGQTLSQFIRERVEKKNASTQAGKTNGAGQ